MAEITIFGLSIVEFLSIIIVILIALILTSIVIIQFYKFKNNKKLLKRISNTIGINLLRKYGYVELEEKVIQNHNQKDLKKSSISEKVKDFINSRLTDSKVYIHFTSRKEVATKIILEGFKYSESIYKTTQEVIQNSVDLNYKLQLYRPYGNFLVVISIPKDLYEFSNSYIKSNAQFSLIDNILSDYFKDEDLEFKLPAEFMLGFIDMENSKIFKNDLYLKNYDANKYKSRIINFSS